MNDLGEPEIRASIFMALRGSRGHRMHVQDIEAFVRSQNSNRALSEEVFRKVISDAVVSRDAAWFDPGMRTTLCLPQRQSLDWQLEHWLGE
jgi:hypothetical protein